MPDIQPKTAPDTAPREWSKRQATPIPIPLSLACALWDFCCSRGRDEDAGRLMDAIECVLPGYFSSARQQPKLGGYYRNSLVAWRDQIKHDLRIGDARMERLDRSGNSCAEDHRAAMAVRRRMLAIVQRALQEHNNAA